MSGRGCGQCGERAHPGDRFCGHCGALLPSPDESAGAEARPALTVAEVNRRLGRVYLARGKRREAVRAWRRAVLLEPEDQDLARLLRELEGELASEEGGAP